MRMMRSNEDSNKKRRMLRNKNSMDNKVHEAEEGCMRIGEVDEYYKIKVTDDRDNEVIEDDEVKHKEEANKDDEVDDEDDKEDNNDEMIRVMRLTRLIILWIKMMSRIRIRGYG